MDIRQILQGCCGTTLETCDKQAVIDYVEGLQVQVSVLKHAALELHGVISEFRALPTKCLERAMFDTADRYFERIKSAPDYSPEPWEVESTFAKLLPKEPLYLDPPDGGSVSVEEQLHRYIADILKQRDQAVASVKEEAYQAYWKASDDNRSDRWADEFDDDVRESFEIWWGSK